MGALCAIGALRRARGNLDRMIRDTAVRQARLPAGEYASLLRAMVGSRKKAPGITDLEPLIDVLVHGQDIALPLDRARPMPAPAAAAAATRADLDLQINLLSEHEVTKLLALVSAIADRMGVKTEVDPEVDELKQDVAPEAVLDEIEERKQ